MQSKLIMVTNQMHINHRLYEFLIYVVHTMLMIEKGRRIVRLPKCNISKSLAFIYLLHSHPLKVAVVAFLWYIANAFQTFNTLTTAAAANTWGIATARYHDGLPRELIDKDQRCSRFIIFLE